MCGIAGIFYNNNTLVSKELLQDMARAMRHRGPDDEGYYCEGSAGLAFQRLSIIDLQTGHQPMCTEDRRFWLVFNGEIYNYQQLRKELQETGRHHFLTESDTEVILHLYEDEGAQCLKRLQGMYAFAIWDSQRRHLFAARDRFGEKPFIYFELPSGGIVFASELKALLKHPACPREVDLVALHQYLSLQYIPAPKTIFKGIYKLPAAHSLEWTPGCPARIRRYWEWSYEPKEDISIGEAKERLRSTLTHSVKMRMISDVPLGAFLSGGIDSSIVVALMAQQSARPVKTFSIGFEDENFSELPFAREVAKKYGTEHHEFMVKPSLVDILPKLAYFYSEPYADVSALPTYYLSQQTKSYVTVALSGDGGDETFAGYLRYKAMEFLHVWERLPMAFRQVIWTLSQKLPQGSAPLGLGWRLSRLFGAGTLTSKSDQYLATLDYIRPEDQALLWRPQNWEIIQEAKQGAAILFESTLKRYKPEHWLDELLFLDLTHYLPDDLMVKTDIASMANSLEVRAPFLDHQYVEEVARWPAHWKYSWGHPSKFLLKETFAKDLPPTIRQRGKQGFTTPVGFWFRGPLKNYIRDILLSPKALQRPYFEGATVKRFLDEHQSGQVDRSYALWALLMLELWHQQFMDAG